MKVALQRTKNLHRTWSFNQHVSSMELTRSVPFFRTHSGSYIHRVRSAYLSFWDGKYKSTVVRFWCGSAGFLTAKPKHKYSRFMEVPEEGFPICATCESRMICGRIVQFSPRS